MTEQTFQATDFGKVAVLMGGWSNERAVSLKSGQAVLTALQTTGIDAHAVDVSRSLVQQLHEGQFDRAFNVLHGRGGEDGLLQGVLELLQLPVTGSGILGSAIAMDKYRTKLVWLGLGLPTPRFVLIETEDQLAEAAELGFPLMIKAALEGSSIGVSYVNDAAQLKAAWQNAKACNSHVIAEQWIAGNEYTASIIDKQVLPLIRLETTHQFYDYAAKYESNDTRYLLPCGLDTTEEKKLQDLSLRAFQAIGASSWGRVDMMRDTNGKTWLIEVNTVPGMTSHSLVPMAAAAVGMDFNELVVHILAQTLQAASP